ncbi:hypothetical protein [Microbulbifer marinus]|uniref:Cytochrome c n=1 Tax=Microbulbifer marinus TaxID=658218 RepID=A0A1H3Y981_9GAMM|nr:hypothetical protein [Microbulbifer marinus]SEA08123.1 cytochrome c [Microbulbifer marinus]
MLLSIAAGMPGITLAEEANSSSQDFGGLPPGAGQAEVYGLCSSCHSLMIVKQQRLSKEAWLDTLDWMIEEQGMPRLPPKSLDLIASYLAEHYGTGGE